MSKIEGQSNLVRNDENMAIINTDTSALNTAKSKKARYMKQNSEINTLRQEVQEMKEILSQINEKMKWQEQ